MVAQKCPYCGEESGQVNNHIRMSQGDGHAEQGYYPDNWDPQAHRQINENGTVDPEPNEQGEEIEEADADLDLDRGGEEISIEEENDEPEESNEREQLEYGDSMDEKREYECGNCGEPLSYLGGDDRDEGGKECPECGERLFWSMMDA